MAKGKALLKQYQRWITLMQSCEREAWKLRDQLTREGYRYNERTDTWER